MTVEVKTKKWGNSIGVIIPKKLVDELNIKPEEKVQLSISKQSNVLKELFGSMQSDKSAEQLRSEVRGDLKSKWLR